MDEKGLVRTLLDESWLIYRKVSGGYAMLRDRCPHRLAPLSMGSREGDIVVCGYHGLAFDTNGKCVRNPFSQLIPPNAKIASLPMASKNGILWFWPGDAELADEARIPDFSYLDEQPDMTRGVTWMAGNYELLTDNLMDLSHIEFIHRDTFQSGGAIFQGEHSVREDDDGAIWSNWDMPAVPRPMFATHMGVTEEKVHQRLYMRWHAPASMSLDISVSRVGEEHKLAGVINPHIITPETKTTSHYFFTCFSGEESERLTRQVFDNEDRPFIEAIQRNMGEQDFWDFKPAILSVDAGAVRARRRLMKLRRVEQPQTESVEAA